MAIIRVNFWRNSPENADAHFRNECHVYVHHTDLAEVIKMLDNDPNCRMLSNQDITVIAPSMLRQVIEVPYKT